MCVPDVEVAHLWAVGCGDAANVARRNLPGSTRADGYEERGDVGAGVCGANSGVERTVGIERGAFKRLICCNRFCRV